MNTIKYKEYVGSVDFDDEIDMFHGRVSNMRDVVSFYGSSVKELRAAMKVSIE
jgi:predicted HicB family RNase H-like nuclease